MPPKHTPSNKKPSDDNPTKDNVNKKDNVNNKNTVNKTPKSQKNEELLPKKKQKKIKQWCVPKRTETSDNTAITRSTQASNSSIVNTQSTSKETSNNTASTSFIQAINTSIMNPQSTSKETSNNTAITSFTQASNTSIVNPSSPITVSTTSTNITTTTTATATSSSIEGGYAILDQMEMSSFRSESERAIFGPSTSTRVTSRNTLGNSKIETVLVDVHRGRDKSTESDDNNNHLVKKRRKVQKGLRPKKTNLNKTNSNDSELSESEDISKQPRPRGAQGKFISKQNKHANDASVNIVGENSCVLESNASVKGVRGRGRPRLNKLAQNILEHNAEKEKK